MCFFQNFANPIIINPNEKGLGEFQRIQKNDYDYVQTNQRTYKYAPRVQEERDE